MEGLAAQCRHRLITLGTRDQPNTPLCAPSCPPSLSLSGLCERLLTHPYPCGAPQHMYKDFLDRVPFFCEGDDLFRTQLAVGFQPLKLMPVRADGYDILLGFSIRIPD